MSALKLVKSKSEKPKRIKRVFSSGDKVTHLWAHQVQSDARSKNVFFAGKSLYSYGYHYELGRLVQYNGVTVALINDTGYSVTTGKHIGWALGSVSHMPHLRSKEFGCREVPNLPVKTLIKNALIRRQGELMDRLFNHFNGRSFWSGAKFERRGRYSDMTDIEQFNKMATQLGMSQLALDINESYIQVHNDHIKTMVARKEQRKAEELARYNSPERVAERAARDEERRLAEAKRKAEDEVRKQKAIANIAKWRQGANVDIYAADLEYEILRIKGDEVETSDGASVPLDHALRLLKLIMAGKAREGERVGHYTLDKVGKKIIEIGCHQIELSEAKAVLLKDRHLKVVQGE